MNYQILKLSFHQNSGNYVAKEIGYPFHLCWSFLSDISDFDQFITWAGRVEPLTATTNSTFLLKKNQMIEIASVFDLLHAPTNGIQADTFLISLQNFIDMVTAWQELIALQPEHIFMVVDEQNQVAIQAQLSAEQQEQLAANSMLGSQDQISCNLAELVTPAPIVIHHQESHCVLAIITNNLTYDYQLQLQHENKYQLLQAQTDEFGVTQGYVDVLATTYLNLYQTTQFPSAWSLQELFAQVASAYENIVEYTHRVINENNQLERVYFIGKSSSGMLISMGVNHKNKMIYVAPIFSAK